MELSDLWLFVGLKACCALLLLDERLFWTTWWETRAVQCTAAVEYDKTERQPIRNSSGGVSSLAETWYYIDKNQHYSPLLFTFSPFNLSFLPPPSHAPALPSFLPLFLYGDVERHQGRKSTVIHPRRYRPLPAYGTAASLRYVFIKKIPTESLWTKENYPGFNIKLDIRRIKCDKHLQMLFFMIRVYQKVTVIFIAALLDGKISVSLE